MVASPENFCPTTNCLPPRITLEPAVQSGFLRVTWVRLVPVVLDRLESSSQRKFFCKIYISNNLTYGQNPQTMRLKLSRHHVYGLCLDYDDLTLVPSTKVRCHLRGGENSAVTIDNGLVFQPWLFGRQQWNLAISARAVESGTLSSWMNPRDGSRATLKIARSAASPTCCAPTMTRHLRSFSSLPSWNNSLP